MAKSRAPRRPLWLITNHENGLMDVFTLGSDGGREILPVFSFEEEAEAFIRLRETETGWRAREIMAGELTSLLHGPYAGVQKVALDPLPIGAGETIFDLVSWGRRVFLRDFVCAAPDPNHERRAKVTASLGLLESPDGESPDGNGTPPQRPERSADGRRTERPPGASPRESAAHP